MKLVVKEDILDYTVIDDLQPMLIFDPDLMWGEYNNGELLSTKLVRSLYMDFVEQLGERLKDSLTERMEIKSAKQFFDIFPHPSYVLKHAEEDGVDLHNLTGEFINDYKVYAYPASKDSVSYAIPEAREAMYSNIFVRNNIVHYSYNNVYKYYEWNELLYELCDLSVYGFSNEQKFDDIEFHDGNTYHYLLITDNESGRGVTNIFNSTIAGCLENTKTKTMIFFNKVQAVSIYVLLHSVCQKFQDEWEEKQYYQHAGHSELGTDWMKRVAENINDSIEEDNPYVHRFYRLCSKIEYSENISKLISYIANTGYGE